MANSIIGSEPLKNYAVTTNGVTIQGTTKEYSTYEAMLADGNPPRYAVVIDASGDPTVDSGRATYSYEHGKWVKVFETEAMDREMDHTHANLESLARIGTSQDGSPTWSGEKIVLQSKLEEVLSSLHGEIEPAVRRLINRCKYTFIKYQQTIDLQEQTYIVRGVRFTGRLPDGNTVPDDVAIRVIVDSDAGRLGGSITCSSFRERINDAEVFNLNAAMDVTIIYDRAAKNWITIGTTY